MGANARYCKRGARPLSTRRGVAKTRAEPIIYHHAARGFVQAVLRAIVARTHQGTCGRTMGQTRGGRSIRCGQLVALAFAGLALANCSGSSNIDPRYGVSSSPRVVEPGQPVPKGGGVHKVGKPYVVAGRTYVPEEDINYRAEGIASWYGDDFHGRLTANGEVFDMHSISAAHPTLPMPSYARVTNLANKKS